MFEVSPSKYCFKATKSLEPILENILVILVATCTSLLFSSLLLVSSLLLPIKELISNPVL